MAKDDLVKIDGKVTNISGGGSYRIMLDNGTEINGKLCGKMKKFSIKIVVGDRVNIGISPYDPTHGLILLRHKVQKQM